jgi:2'-5' RNA ligase
MSPRYAVYYTPAAGTPLAVRAASWLGRCAYDGQPRARADLPALADLDLDALTADPRLYGFHATLKAPFELAEGRGEGEILAFAERFAAGRPAFTAPIAVAALGSFLAFRLAEPTSEMEALHAACVRDFEPFRAAISEFDLARRRKRPLTPGQDGHLVRWGYPYVFDEFRFHMTLTGAIRDEAQRRRVLEALTTYFAAESGVHAFDGVAVFRQAQRGAPFEVAGRFAFRQAAAALSA